MGNTTSLDPDDSSGPFFVTTDTKLIIFTKYYPKNVLKWEPVSSTSSSSPLYEGKTIVKERPVCPETCKVCGGAASGYHYEVESCNGCKTFFRRSICGQRKYVCVRGGTCASLMSRGEFPFERRLRCRKCRLERCIEIGMNPLAIEAEAHPEQNKMIRKILERKKESSSSSMDTSPVVLANPPLIESSIDGLVSQLMHVEIAHERIRRSRYSPKPFDGYTLDDVLSGSSKLGIDYGDMPGWPRKQNVKTHGLSLQKILEERIRIPPLEEIFMKDPSAKVWPFADIVYSIEYFKTFEVYHRLCHHDKRVVARSICMMISNLMKSFFSFTMKSDMTLHPDGTQPYGGKLPGDTERRAHCSLISRMKSLNIDRTEHVLLKAIAACNPALDDLTQHGREVLQEEREKLNKSLLSYVLARKGLREGPSAYVNLLSLLDYTSHLVKHQKENYTLICVLGLLSPCDGHLVSEILI